MSTEKPPLILVTADVRELDSYRWHAAIDTYARAVVEAGGLPVIVPALGADMNIGALLSRADGVLVTGSRSNVHPEIYGAEASTAHEPYDPARDATTLPLIRGALDQGKALLAICRGHQELNVAMGGTLETDVHVKESRFDHLGLPPSAPVDARFANRHEIAITAHGLLHAVLGTLSVSVNSVHKQAIAKLGNGLTVEAKADDGTIESISVKGAKRFALGVQWHPEYWASQAGETDPPSTAIFRAFLAAAAG